MSEGPISEWWRSHEPPKASTSDKDLVCMVRGGRGYCGRKNSRRSAVGAEVTCADCVAARRADEAVAS